MKTEQHIKDVIADNRKALKLLAENGEDRDWEANDELEKEIEVLEWVLK